MRPMAATDRAYACQHFYTTRFQFDSIALNYVLHCLPGPMSHRASVVRNLVALLKGDGVLFGATVLGTPELHTWLSRVALRENNRHGIFDNLSDTQGHRGHG